MVELECKTFIMWAHICDGRSILSLIKKAYKKYILSYDRVDRYFIGKILVDTILLIIRLFAEKKSRMKFFSSETYIFISK